MRVADGQNQLGFLRNLQRVKVDMNDALERMYTGRRVRFASDDPHAASELMRLEEDMQRLGSQSRGLSQARAWLELGEQAIAETEDILIEAKTLAIQASSDTTQTTTYAALVETVAAFKSQLRGLAGYRVSGNYIFSGTMTNVHPYDAAGTYQGNSSQIKIPLDEGELTLNFTADDLFGEIGSGGPMDIIDRFETALRDGDSETVKSMVGELDAAIGANSTKLARIGSRRGLLEDSDLRIQDRSVEIASRAADLGSADMAKAISDVQRLDTNYQAALSAGARFYGNNFFDYLG